MAEKILNKTCFVVGPIGDPDSDVRIHADWLLEEIIQPVLKSRGYEVVRADQITQPGMIDAQVIRYLMDADLVIADLSMLNPNAFYEIGIRHMVQKPIIHVQLNEDKIPFDVSLYRATKFSRSRPSDLRRARQELEQAVIAVSTKGYQIDNPITRARGQIRLEEQATPEQKIVLDQIRMIQDRLEVLESAGTLGQDSPEIRPARRLRPRYINYYVQFDPSHKNFLKARNAVTSQLLVHNGIESVHADSEEVYCFPIPESFVKTAGWRQCVAQLESIPGVMGVSEIPF